MTDTKNNTGLDNTGYWNTGDRNTGYWNTGYRNTGDRNTGNWNTGYWNTGNRNTGYWNTGNWNTGHWNTGDRNTGYRNTGDRNTGNRNTGYFNTITPDKVMVFNGAMVGREAFINACPNWLYQPSPTTWVPDTEMTDQERVDNPTFHTCEGYLRKNDWTAEWAKAFAEASQEDVQKVRDLPGFDADVFKEITGLDLSAPTKPENPREIIIDGATYVLKG